MNSICIVTPYPPTITETFITAHVDRMPAKVTLVHGWRPTIGSRRVLSPPLLAYYKARRLLTGDELARETTAAYLKVFRQYQIEAVLAEYGETGVVLSDAIEQSGIPLVVHFHGYDASVTTVLEEHRDTYPRMFKVASAIVAVSHAMKRKLIELGAAPEKVHYNPYGVDSELFGGAHPATSPPIFVAVGRFIDKKAPHLTIAAFAATHRECPEARLRMVGGGPLLDKSKELAHELGVGSAIEFLGFQSHSVVESEMRSARCFVQHSIVAPSGDCEGTPVAILEAGATGLPVVATRHAGIPDVVVEGSTGFLVDEGDVSGMAAQMVRLAREPELAGTMGAAARQHIMQNFSRTKRINRLWEIIESCIKSRQPLNNH